MKITNIEVIELRVPSWDASTFDGSWDDVVLKVHTDAGITGIAEIDSVPHVIRAIVEAPSSHTGSMGLKECIVGQDPTDIEALWQRMYYRTRYVGRRGRTITMSTFGASAPIAKLADKFGFTVDNVVKVAKEMIGN